MSAIKAIDGLPVIDAKGSVILHVTKANVTRGSNKDPKKCAVALACHREMHAIEVRVHLSRVYVRRNNTNWERYFAPTSMRTEVVSFDRSGVFEPRVFTLTPVWAGHALGTKRRGGKATPKSNGKGKKRAPYHVITNVRNGPA